MDVISRPMNRVRVVLESWDPNTARVELDDGTPIDGVQKCVIEIVPNDVARVTLTILAPLVDVTGDTVS